MNEVFGELDAQVATNGAGGRVTGVGGTHHGAHNLPGVLWTLDDRKHCRATCDEVDKAGKERLAGVLAVMNFGRCPIDGAQLGANDLQVAALETGKDFAHETPFNGVGLTNDERAVCHSEARRYSAEVAAQTITWEWLPEQYLRTMIEAQGLQKRFGTAVAVDDVSFSVQPGMVTGFLGPNGAGKSTTCRLMVGLDNGEGSTRFDGLEFRDIAQPMRQVGVLLEAKAFHPTRTARSHLKMLCAANGIDAKRADECLSMVGLSEVAKKKPKGFSLGMAQRLGLAAAMLGDPRTLILDEPGNGLDPQGIQWLRDLLRFFASEGRTVLVSSHLLSEMELMADHVIVIGRGKLIADCTTQEFIARGSQHWVVIRTPQPEALTATLTQRGIEWSAQPDGAIQVRGATAAAVGDAAHHANAVVHELSNHRSSLEEAFLELTGSANQFAGQAVPTAGFFVTGSPS